MSNREKNMPKRDKKGQKGEKINENTSKKDLTAFANVDTGVILKAPEAQTPF